MSYGNNSPQPAAPSMPIPGAVEAVGYQINALQDVADLLAKRLDGLLTPMTEVTGKAQNSLAPVPRANSVMTGDLENHRSRIEIVTSRLTDLLNRLEV